MEIKNFNGNKITIRKVSKKDFKNVKRFRDFISSLVKEDVKILMHSIPSLKKEQNWLAGEIGLIKKHKKIILIAEHNKKIIGNAGIGLDRERKDHIGVLGISIRSGYRGIGLGKYLMAEVLKLAKKELKPRPKIIRLEVFSNNKPAISLYKKMGFDIVARLPKQIQYKGRLVDEFVMLLHL